LHLGQSLRLFLRALLDRRQALLKGQERTLQGTQIIQGKLHVFDLAGQAPHLVGQIGHGRAELLALHPGRRAHACAALHLLDQLPNLTL
jgi:hypothetical protein